MRKTSLGLALVVAGLILSPSAVRAEQYDNLISLPIDENQAAVFDQTALGEGEVLGEKTAALPVVENRGPHFFYGEEQILNEDLVGDVYVLAGRVEINSNIDGDLLVVGGKVVLNGDVSQDVRAAAGTIYVNGVIGQNLTVAGGQIIFADTVKVGNSIVAGGGEVSLDGQTQGKVLLGGGAARLAGVFGSDVQARADTFRVMPGVVINGSLIADAYTSADVPDDVQVAERKLVKIVPPEERQPRTARANKMEPLGGVLVKTELLQLVIKLVIGLISGCLLIYFLPKLVNAVKTQVLASPQGNFGWGLVYLFMTPIVILVALISVVAIPIAGLIFLAYLGSMIVAKTMVAIALGEKLAERFKSQNLKNPYLVFALGFVVLKVVGVIPIIGWLVSFGAFVMGMGALFTLAKGYLFGGRK